MRYRLIQRVLRDASKRGGLRFHVACADNGDNVELFMQAGFMRYGEEILLYRSPEQEKIASFPVSAARDAGIRPTVPLDALALDRLYRKRLQRPWPVSRTIARSTGSARATTGGFRGPPSIRSSASPTSSHSSRRHGWKVGRRGVGLLSDRRVEGGSAALHSRHLTTRPRSFRSDCLRPVGHC